MCWVCDIENLKAQIAKVQRDDSLSSRKRLLELQKQLQNLGVNVVMTRECDGNMSLNDRVKLAKDNNVVLIPYSITKLYLLFIKFKSKEWVF